MLAPLVALLPVTLLLAPAARADDSQGGDSQGGGSQGGGSQGGGTDIGLTVEAYGQQVVGEGPAVGLGARLHPTRATFVVAEGRGAVGGHWIGRGTVGLDLLGASKTLDFTLGLFLGTTGSWAPIGMNTIDPTAGFELGLGLNVGPVRGRYRHADGFRGPLESRLTENEWRLGAELGRFQVFGQYIRFNLGDDQAIGGLGAGASVAF